MTDTATRTKDPTAAARAKRYRERKRALVPVTPTVTAVTVPKPSRTVTASRAVTLTALQWAAIDALIDTITDSGEQAGPWLDREPAVPLELWRTKVRTMFAEHANARQMVRRTMRTLITSGCVIERDGWVAVGDFIVEIEVVSRQPKMPPPVDNMATPER
jgi:hypothetical protein